MTLTLQILGGWALLSVAFAFAWGFIRSRQKQRARILRRLAFEAYQLERARHYHIITEYRRIGAL